MSSGRSPRGAAVAMLALAALLVAAMLATRMSKLHEANEEQRARESMRQQVADARSGKNNLISISNETEYFGFGMDEFAKLAPTFEAAGDFAIHTEYSHDIDDFLRSIAGSPGIRSVQIGQGDLSDTGLRYVASLPQLKHLSLYDVAITDAGLAQLRICENLEALLICPAARATISLRDILLLPMLRRATLIDPPARGGWLKSEFEQLKEASALDELVLVTDELNSEQIDELRKQLPRCSITLKARNTYGK
jgi:hypothetical protein